ncbi:TIGR00730 family Rossman fold protein [Halobacillus shinanisalinarum]|uniref:Cytokinin riboside 5'-monophosphate phosphoribohydrolase n=1 Tax=Halobacillus shinanisalinarum TaxID=2932258 RepID=A0ABY4H5C7_9BACI|nr:TIGR00730 family Rossman fold protein [Halobacillus shinanisalinarum]UOQ94787.1 TIGR00730 family Rossman fold protein [Halobacillus shinanisalinarum]
MKKIAVFCGSSPGASDAYIEGAKKLGKEMVKRDITLVYGGASVGMMGALADTILEEGGHVIGVMPDFLEKREIAHKDLTELIVVGSMHERKTKMSDLADGFIALPGGPGTMEEYFEIFTWAQLGLHQKPCGLLNVNRYFDPLLALFKHMTKEQFLNEKYLSIALSEPNPSSLLDHFYSYEPPKVKTYITSKDET